MITRTPREARTAWRDVSDDPAELSVSVLASYTADQLVPYLGIALHDVGLPARCHVGPFDQIVRQCLDDDGETATARPDVLVVSPRFEELADSPQWTSDLVDLADAAAATVGRWAGALLFVLPALPAVVGMADNAAAIAAREAVRTRLAGRPNVLLADLDDAVRELGERDAHHPTMFALAKVPYTEELFSRLGTRLARALAVRHGVVCRGVLIDVEGLTHAAALRDPVRALHRAGVRLAVRTGGDDAVWSRLAADCPELVEHCEPVAAGFVPITTDPDRHRRFGGILLGPRPEQWAAELRATTVFDRPAPPGRRVAAAVPVPAATAPVGLDDFVTSLNVQVAVTPGASRLAAVAEVVSRAKDFTLANDRTEAELAAFDGDLLAVTVTDRFGDHGVSGAVAVRWAGGTGTVEVFSLSCPVLGRRVEDAVLADLVRRATERGCTDLVFRFHETPHNGVATAFLRAARPAGVTVHALTWADPSPAPTGVAFGIVGFGHALPEASDVPTQAPSYTAELDRVRGWGYRRFHRAPDGVGLTDLAAEAGARALAEAGVDPAEVDLVVLAIADLAEYLYWDPAAATQARLGATNAEAVLVNQACGGGVAAFDLAAGKFAVHPAYRTALVVGANRVVDPYWNRMEINTSVYSDGAAAAVLRRDHGTCRWLATEVISDGTYADFMRMEVGAGAHPFVAGDAEQPHVRNPQDRLDDFFGGDVRRMFGFVSMIRDRAREVVDRACARAGVSRSDLRKVLHFNDNLRQLTDFAKDVGVALADTNVETALDHGHVGCADQLLALSRLMADGELAPGDLVALTSTSSGMHWMCTLLRI